MTDKKNKISKQEQEDFNFGHLMTYEKEKEKIRTVNKGVFISLILLIIIVSTAFSISIYTYKDRFVVITDKTYYQAPSKKLLAEVFAKNYTLDLLEFDLYNVQRKIKNIYRLSKSKSNAREKIQQLLHEKYAEKTQTIGLTRIFIINEIDGVQSVKTNYEKGVYSTTIKGIQSNINTDGTTQLEIKIVIKSIKASPSEKKPEIFQVVDFKIESYIKK